MAWVGDDIDYEENRDKYEGMAAVVLFHHRSTGSGGDGPLCWHGWPRCFGGRPFFL